MEPEVIAIRTAYLEKLCHKVAPRDLDDTPVYVIDTAELFPGGCLLWGGTSGSLDWIAKPYLEAVGRWRGRGVAIALNFNAIEEADPTGYSVMPLLRETTLHELAHALERTVFASDWEPVGDDAAMLRHAYDTHVVSEHVPSMVGPWNDGHGDRFVRACLHLYHRARGVLAPVYDVDRLCAGTFYGLSSARLYLDALTGEPELLRDAPIRDILATPAPAEFAELFARDTMAWQRAAAVYHPVCEEKTVFDKLKASLLDRKRTRDVSFQALARRIAGGDSPDAASVESVLETSGKSVDELEAAVNVFRRRDELQTQLKQAREAEAALPAAKARIKAVDDELKKAEEAHEAKVFPLVSELKRLESVAGLRHQCEPELYQKCPSEELREQRDATDSRMREVVDELKKTQRLLDTAKADLRDVEYKLEFGSRERFTEESLKESAETYRGRVTRHEAAVAELRKEEAELIAKRDATYSAMIAF